MPKEISRLPKKKGRKKEKKRKRKKKRKKGRKTERKGKKGGEGRKQRKRGRKEERERKKIRVSWNSKTLSFMWIKIHSCPFLKGEHVLSFFFFSIFSHLFKYVS